MLPRNQANIRPPLAAAVPQRPAVFIGSEIFRQPAFGRHHPLSSRRITTVADLCASLGWLEPGCWHTSQPASKETLTRFHDADYVAALEAADQAGEASAQVRARYRIGTMENPLFPGLFRRAATTVGGSIRAAELALQGAVAYHPAGGTHHGRPDRASGFCYFNDPVFALQVFLDHGLERVLYADLDAHHGDGVQDAFLGDARVLALSVHEEGRWPYSGTLEDRGHGHARNLPVPRGFNDSELGYVMREGVLPLAARFQPQATVIVCGADGLAGDPLSGLLLSNVALWEAVLDLVRLSPRAVVLGGGGYNPWTAARCWAGLWGLLRGHLLPDRLTPSAQALLQGLECDLVDAEDRDPAWLTTLADDPRPGPVRPELVRRVERMLQ